MSLQKSPLIFTSDAENEMVLFDPKRVALTDKGDFTQFLLETF